ncbi:MAG: CotH kinase family protein, partial [Defluviitaleaceae bacterium]|nr:CotH kinase family protein [Defluviitaleaceae bacterium]
MKRLLFLLLIIFPTAVYAEESTLSPPVFSHAAGFYDEPFELTLTSDPGTTIRFTTDGSVPTEASPVFGGAITISSPAPTIANSPMSVYGIGWAYEGEWTNTFRPRPVYNGMVIRARAFGAGVASETVTQSFFVDAGEFENVRVISLVMEPYQFTHRINGMYNNWGPRREAYDPRLTSWPNPQWEGTRHVVSLEMFAPGGELIVAQEARAWVMGQYSRRHAKRSFRMNFNQGDGDIRRMSDFIPGSMRNFYDPTTEISDFRHINARLSEQHSTGVRDSIVHLMSEPLRPAIQNVIYGAMFINGEFWGMYCLRTHRHQHLLGEMFDVPRGSIWMNGDEQDWANAIFIYEIIEDFLRARGFTNLRNTQLSPSAISEFVNNGGMDAFAQRVCVDDFIDYLIIGYHFGNWDWIGNNFEYWRSTEIIPDVHGGDGRYRFIVQDFDHSIGSHFAAEFNVLHDFTTPDPSEFWRRPQWVLNLVNIMFATPEFRNTFAARYSTYTGTVFHPEMAHHIVDNIIEERASTMGMDSYRWRLHDAQRQTDNSGWLYQMSVVRNWLTDRTNYSVAHLVEHYNRTDRPSLNLRLPTSLTNITWQTDMAP